MVAAVERVEADRVDRLRAPQAQRIHPMPAPADDRRVVGHRHDLLLRLPRLPPGGTVLARLGRHHAAEVDFVRRLAPLEFPQVAVGEPVFRHLDLAAVADLLPEQSVHVTDAIAVGRDGERRHGLHEARGKAPEAAVAERSVRLQCLDLVEVDTEANQRLLHRLHQLEVRHRVAQQPADQKLKAKVIDALRPGRVRGARRLHPSVDRAVAHHQDRRRQPVVRFRNDGILADRIGELVDNFGLQRLRIDLAGQRLDVVGGCVHVRDLTDTRAAA